MKLLLTRKILLLIIFLSTAYALVLIFSYSKTQPKTIIPSAPSKILVQTPVDTVNTDFLSYQNHLLGVDLKYPKQWGNIITSPDNITNLSYLGTDQPDYRGTRDRISLVFENQAYLQPRFTFYSDQYLGENPPYSEYGDSSTVYLDNFSVLKSTGNICDYHEKFNDAKTDHREIAFSCDPKTNTSQSLVEVRRIFESGKVYYQYYLKHYFYQKLKNGFYNHLLVSETIYVVESENNPVIKQLSDIPNYSPQLEPAQKYNQFRQLTSSIKSISVKNYSPQKHPKIFTSDSNISTIYQYYSYLEQGKLQSSYALYQKPSVSFSDYQAWYKNTIFTDILNIKRQENGPYQIDVNLQDRNQPIATYRVIMEVNSGKINTISSVGLIEEKVLNPTLSARIILSNNFQKLIVNQNSQDFTLATCQNYPPSFGEKFVENCHFSRLNFTPDGSYLYVGFGAWEYGSNKVYDLQTKKEILEVYSPQLFTYLETTRQIIACHGELFGIGGDQYAGIFDLNNRGQETSIFNLINQEKTKEEMVDFKCNYDPNQNTVIINADFYLGGSSKEYSKQYLYQIDTGKLTAVSRP